MPVAYRNGAPVMLTDVAGIVNGVENNAQAAWMNQTPAVILNVTPARREHDQRGQSIKDSAAGSQLAHGHSGDHAYRSYDGNRSVCLDVEFELLLTIGLVVLVIFSLLAQSLRHHYPGCGCTALTGGNFSGDVLAGI